MSSAVEALQQYSIRIIHFGVELANFEELKLMVYELFQIFTIVKCRQLRVVRHPLKKIPVENIFGQSSILILSISAR